MICSITDCFSAAQLLNHLKFIAEWVIFDEMMEVHLISMASSKKGKEDHFSGTRNKQRMETNTGCYWNLPQVEFCTVVLVPKIRCRLPVMNCEGVTEVTEIPMKVLCGDESFPSHLWSFHMPTRVHPPLYLLGLNNIVGFDNHL